MQGRRTWTGTQPVDGWKNGGGKQAVSGNFKLLFSGFGINRSRDAKK